MKKKAVMMMSGAAFTQARSFVETRGRPLDRVRFRIMCGEAGGAELIDALAAYLNPDGGFGFCLEPDDRLPVSSVLATTIAFQILRENDVRSAPFVGGAAAYLMREYDAGSGSWRLVPRHPVPVPQAPWWNEYAAKAVGFELNPTAEVLGYLMDHPEGIPGKIFDGVMRRVLGTLESAEKIVMHDFLCCKRLFDTRDLPAGAGAQLKAHLTRLLTGVIETDPAKWGGYCLRPIQVIDSPRSVFLPGYEAAVEENLDYDIRTQKPDGSWDLNWSWAAAYPLDWPKAEAEWKSALVIEKLRTLASFGRVEGV